MKIAYTSLFRVGTKFTNPVAVKNFKQLTEENCEKLDKLLESKYPTGLPFPELEKLFATLPEWFKATLKESGCTAF